MPPYFVKEGLESFRAAQTIESDVVMVSYPKCGTSWLHQVLFCLLRMDEDGTFEPIQGASPCMGAPDLKLQG